MPRLVLRLGAACDQAVNFLSTQLTCSLRVQRLLYVDLLLEALASQRISSRIV